MSVFIVLASIWFFKNFEDKINMGEEIKGQLMQGLNGLGISLDWLFIGCVLVFGLNMFFVTSQMFWHTLLDSSWCNNNYYNREKATKDKVVTD